MAIRICNGHKLKAKEIAEFLLEHPDMDVAIRKFGGDNRWPISSATVVTREGTCDSSSLGEEFIVLDSQEGEF
jgi:hypothetical protein